MKKVKKKSKLKSLLGILACALPVLLLIHNLPKSKDYIRKRSVLLEGNNYLCSGVQVHLPSGQDYILSAGHCHELAINESIHVITEDHKQLERKVIAEDPKSDLLLLEGIPNLRGLDIGSRIHMNEEIQTFTHGSGYPTYETSGYLIGKEHVEIPIFSIHSDEDDKRCKSQPKFKEQDGLLEIHMSPSGELEISETKVCVLSITEIVTNARIVPGSSGGMAVNSKGDLVGIASATNGLFGGLFGLLVDLKDIKAFLSGY